MSSRVAHRFRRGNHPFHCGELPLQFRRSRMFQELLCKGPQVRRGAIFLVLIHQLEQRRAAGLGAVEGLRIPAQLSPEGGGLLRNIIIGVAGSAVGGIVASLLGFYVYGVVANLIVNVAGACLFILIGRKLFR